MPACWKDHITRPEQSNWFGPPPPQTYGSPMRVSAAWTAMAPSSVPGPGAGTAAIGITSAAAGASGGASIGGSASGAGAARISGGGTGPGAASATRWFGVSVW